MIDPIKIEVCEVDQFTRNIAKTVFMIVILEDESIADGKSVERVKNDDYD